MQFRSLQWKEKVQALNQRRREWATKIAVEEPQSVVHPVARYDETSGEPAKSFVRFCKNDLSSLLLILQIFKERIFVAH